MKLSTKQETIVTYSGLSVGLLLFLLVIFGLILTSCSRENIQGSGRVVTEERSVGDFEDLTLEGPLEVHLRQGQLKPVVIEAEDNIMHVIETYVSGSRLNVRIRNGVNLKNVRPIQVYIQSEEYRKIIFAGSGSLRANDTIHSTLLSYEINGSADARLKLDANELTTIVHGSGDITLEGKASKYHSEIDGSGDVDATALQVTEADIHINGSGEQRIWVLNLLNIHINGSGNVKYKGTPGTLNTKINGSGRVIKL